MQKLYSTTTTIEYRLVRSRPGPNYSKMAVKKMQKQDGATTKDISYQHAQHLICNQLHPHPIIGYHTSALLKNMKKNKTGTHIMLCIAPQVTDEYVKKQKFQLAQKRQMICEQLRNIIHFGLFFFPQLTYGHFLKQMFRCAQDTT